MKKFTKLLWLLLCLNTLFPLVVRAQEQRPTAKGLSVIEADKRKSMIDQVAYDLMFDLNEKNSEFSGEVRITFDLKNVVYPLTVDFAEGTIQSVQANQNKVDDIDYNGHFLTLARDKLKTGTNQLVIRFKHPYSTTGSGLHRFQDPIDKSVYVYTDFEPYDANKLFPCFDQPDLKATYKVKVEAPSNWIVVSSVAESKTTTANLKKTWSFEQSLNFSTYIFSLHAGPYHVFKGQAKDIPLRLMVRRSLAKYINPEDWLKVTRQGLEFYQEYFAHKYPFKKYDQLIVPDFNAGAMENVAAVTFSERYVFRSKPTRDQLEDIAEVVLHEMAHMWFGDLVTMRWWNGLWLNESFATYMSYLAMNKATDFHEAAHSFFVGMKQWAYWEDQLVTTHPIEVEVKDTEDAFTNFDGITYGKGASVLHQLAYFLGEEKFRDGVRIYFRKHAFKNATLQDFMGALEEGSGTDLTQWTKQWLNLPGLNTVKALYQCTGGKIAEFTLFQSAPKDHPQLRVHRTEVALYAFDPKMGLKLQETADVTYNEAKTDVKSLVGKACPDLVYPNRGDFDYVKVQLDPRSLETTKKVLKLGAVKGTDPLLRNMLWRSLWEMVRDGEWSLTEFADLALSGMGKETSIKTLTDVLELLYGRRVNSASVLAYLPQPGEPNEAIGQKYFSAIEAFLWKGLKNAKPGTDEQKLWFDGYVRGARSKEGSENLAQILVGKTKLPGFVLDQDRRWDVLVRLSVLGFMPSAEVTKLIETESKKDPSDKGSKMAIAADAVRPLMEVKKKWFQTITDPKAQLPLSKMRQAMVYLFPRTQWKLQEAFAPSFYSTLPEIAKKRESEYLEAFTENLVPALCTEKSVKDLQKEIATHDDLPSVVLRPLKVAHQEDQRCVSIRAASLKP